MRFDHGGGGLLHLACLAQNIPAALYLTSAGIDPAMRDHKGRTADQLCFSGQIQGALSDKYRISAPKDKRRQSLLRLTDFDAYSLPAVLGQKKRQPAVNLKKHIATDFDVDRMFNLASHAKYGEELLILLQTLVVDVNTAFNDDGDLLMHAAVKQGLSQLPLMTALQRLFGADINRPNRHGMTPMHVAAEIGESVLLDCMACVLGADPNLTNLETGWAPLHYACHANNEAAINTLIKRGAHVNLEDLQGARPDDVASLRGHQDAKQIIHMHRISRFLHLIELSAKNALSKGDFLRADLFLTDEDGMTLIMIAAEYNAPQSLRLLLSDSQAPIDAQHEKTLKPALSMAAFLGNYNAVDILLSKGASPSVRDAEGLLPLHHAVRGGQLEVIRLILSFPEGLTGLGPAYRLSLSSSMTDEIKAAMNRRQRELVTPTLFECAMNGNADKLYCLLEQGDNVNPSSAGGDWPLSLAVENGHLNCVELLIEWGGDFTRLHPNTADSVLHLAAARGHLHILKFLLTKILRPPPVTPAEVASCMVNHLNAMKQTPLMLAAEHGFSQIVRLLLSNYATASLLDTNGHLYHCDMYQGVQALLDQHRRKHTEDIMSCIRQKRGGLKRIRAVFLPPFDHSLRDDNGMTPLMVACSLGHRDLVKVLRKSAVYSINTASNTLQRSPESVADSVMEDHDASDVDVRSAEDVLCSFMQTDEPQVEMPLDPCPPPPPDDGVLHNNIPTLLDSIVSLTSGSVFTANGQVNHFFATCPKDGSTALHQLISAGDYVDILSDILDCDQSAINAQDNEGCSPLHLACKFRRTKCVEKLAPLPFVDLNCRTLDGKLPEEMTTNSNLICLIKRHREQSHSSSPRRRMSSLRSGLLGASPKRETLSECESHMDFERLNSRFLMLKQQPGEYNSILQ